MCNVICHSIFILLCMSEMIRNDGEFIIFSMKNNKHAKQILNRKISFRFCVAVTVPVRVANKYNITATQNIFVYLLNLKEI